MAKRGKTIMVQTAQSLRVVSLIGNHAGRRQANAILRKAKLIQVKTKK